MAYIKNNAPSNLNFDLTRQWYLCLYICSRIIGKKYVVYTVFQTETLHNGGYPIDKEEITYYHIERGL